MNYIVSKKVSSPSTTGVSCQTLTGGITRLLKAFEMISCVSKEKWNDDFKTWRSFNSKKEECWALWSLNLNPTEMVWDEWVHRVKERQLKSAHHMWEKHFRWIHHEEGWKNIKIVQSCYQSNRWVFKNGNGNLNLKTYFYTFSLTTKFHLCNFLDFNVFSFNLY